MADISEKLLKMRKTIDSDKREYDQLQGRIAGDKERLDKEFGIKTVKAGETKLTQLEKEIANSEAALVQGITALEESYDFD